MDIRPEIDRITDIGPSPEYIEYTAAWSDLNRATDSFDFNQDAYLAIDNDVPVFGVQTEEEIIAESQLAPESEPETSQETVQNLSKGEAKKHLQALKMYLMKSSNDNSEALKSLAGIEQALVANEMQSSITSYFTV